MFSWLKDQILEREIRKSQPVKKQFIAWQQIQNAVILLEAGRQSRNDFKTFVKDLGKDVYIIAFHKDKISKSSDCYMSVNKKDLNILGLPKRKLREKLRVKSFDLMINMDFTDDNGMMCYSGIIPAKFKVGPEAVSYNRLFDISIKSGKEDFIEQADKYLKMIKS
jgi:hypothetical protein